MSNPEANLEICKRKTAFQVRLADLEQKAGLNDAELSNADRDEIFRRLGRVIGNTPIRPVRLPNGNVLLQKDETANPTETHYDRCYLFLLKKLEKEGVIKPGDTLLETTSGSAGISFSWLCRKLGYRSVVFLPSYVPQPRIVEINNLADEVHLNDDKGKYLKGCSEDMMLYLRANRERIKGAGHNIWMPNHSQDFATPEAFSSVAHETCRQIVGANIDFFVGGIGNGSTLLGIGRKLKGFYPDLKVVAYEPLSACPYYKKYRDKWGNVAPKMVDDSQIPADFSFHDLPGVGSYGNIRFPFVEEAIEQGIIDDVCTVSDSEILSLASARYNEDLPDEMHQGNTSIVSRFVAEQMAQKMTNQTILSLIYDRADRCGLPKYLEQIK